MPDSFNPLTGLMEGGAGAGVEIPADVAITAFGEALITAANAAAGRAVMGVVIGADVQPFNAILTDLAGLTQAANKGIYFDSATTAATFDLSSVGRTLVGQSTQALMRTTGLGATTVGAALFTLANPSAETYLRINADNSVVALSGAAYRSSIGLVIGSTVQAWSDDLDNFVSFASWDGSDNLILAQGLQTGDSVLIGAELQVVGGTTLAAMTCTAINGNVITASSGTLTLGAGKTLGVANSLTFTGNDGTTFAFPTASSTVVTLIATQTLTNKTLTSPDINGGTADSLTSLSIRNLATAFDLVIASDSSTMSANRTLTLDIGNTNRALTLAGDILIEGELSIVNGGNVTFETAGNASYTLPATSGTTLATLTGTETLTNKTLTGAILTNTAGSTVATFNSTASNDDPNESIIQNRVGTNNATPTVILTITIPASTTTGIKAWVVARRTGGAAGTTEDGAFYEVSVVYKNVGGTATIIGSPTITPIGESQAAWDVTLNPTSNTVQILGTGAASNDVVWAATVHLFQIGT